jgi:DNA polymerase I
MKTLFLDIETTGLDPFTCELVTLQLMTDSGEQLIIKDPTSLGELKPVLEGNLVVGQNIKFDSKFLKYHCGITLYNVYDTQIMEIAISGGLLAGKEGSKLDDLVFKYCGVKLDKSEQCGFKRGQLLTENQIKYVANDVRYLPEIMKSQQAKIKLLGLENVLETEMKAIPAVVWLELSGIYVDQCKLDALWKEVEAQKQQAENELHEIFGTNSINLNSTQQLKETLNKMDIPVLSTGKDELKKFNDPVINILLKYKNAVKMLSSFTKTLPKHISRKTGRVYASFNQYGAISGRFTSSKPNMQQQPQAIRPIFCAEPGSKLVISDYSQIELRILGQVAGEKEFINAYISGIDLHKLTASKVFKVPLEKVTDQQRNTAKKINFGTVYGGGSPMLVRSLREVGITVSEEEALGFIKGFKKAYPAISRYLVEISEEGTRKLELRNKAGRLFKFECPKDDYGIGIIGRESKNLPIQSLCADMIKIAMGNLFLILEPMGVKLINTVHDELVFECSADQAEEVKEIVKTEMEKAGKLFLTDLPCEAKVIVCDTWEK